LCASGAVILAVGLIGASLVPVQTNVAPLVLCSAVCGIGFGLFQVPNNRNLFLSAPPERSAAAGGVQATARLTGQTLGAILVSSLFALSSTEIAPRVAMMVAGASALAAALLSALRVTAASSQPSRT
jgi:DHA2 family multidrug resistance protein-like MFS transporter